MRPCQGTRCDPLKKLCSIYQRGRNIEAYVEEFLSYCHFVPGDDALLRDCFWSGLTWISASTCLMRIQVGPWRNILTVLLFCGSEFTVGEVEEEVSPKHFFAGGAVGRGLQWPRSPADQGCQLATMPHPDDCKSSVCHHSHPTARANSQDGCHAPIRVSTQDGRHVTARVNIQNGRHIKVAAMSQPESAPKIAARPQPEPPPARAASSPATSSARVATSPVWFAMPKPPAVMKAMPRSSATMDDTPEFPVVMDVKPEFPVVGSVVFGDNAFSGRLRLSSSLADPPLRSVRATGIPRPSAVEVMEVFPLSAVLPVMAVAMLCVCSTLYSHSGAKSSSSLWS